MATNKCPLAIVVTKWALNRFVPTKNKLLENCLLPVPFSQFQKLHHIPVPTVKEQFED